MTEILQAKNLVKQFGSFTAVDNISFVLKEGEILGLLGPNGAGKTTTIQMLLGVLTPTAGEVFYFGKNLKQRREQILEQVNFSSTYTNLPWDLTVWENLHFASYLYQIADRKKRIGELLEIFKIADLRKNKLNSLSSGQITRVNLAKAFLNSPKVLLLDEPTASLDPDVAGYIREFILRERKKFQVSIVFSSHNMAEVEELCDRVIFINHGRVVANNTPEGLAKTIEVCHVELRPADPNLLLRHCASKGLPARRQGKYCVVDVKESKLAEFLRELGSSEIVYEEISIDKPTLEDFFIQNSLTK
ncbi:MAG: ABC transporter ATP-binding protein [Patescibacteria group bacterium]|nr:ABC transporter ATP-binding protein [Patescibacteria group bacterium]